MSIAPAAATTARQRTWTGPASTPAAVPFATSTRRAFAPTTIRAPEPAASSSQVRSVDCFAPIGQP